MMALILALLAFGLSISRVSSCGWNASPARPCPEGLYTKCEDLTDGVYQITIPYGAVSGDRKYLSTTEDGSNVDLWNEDDESGRQKWTVTKYDGYFTIQIYGGVNSGKSWLSTEEDGNNVDLWDADDESGRQRWKIFKSDNYDDIACNIEIYGGVSGDKKLLSTTDDGTNVDLWTHDDGSYRQRWRFYRIYPTAKSVGSGDIISDLGLYDDDGKHNNIEIIINSNGYWFVMTCMAVVILLIVMNVTLCYKLKMGQNIRYKPVEEYSV